MDGCPLKKSTIDKLQEFEINKIKYTLGKILSAPGDWWDGHQPIRRCEPRDESYFIGMALETTKGWWFVGREYLMEPRSAIGEPLRLGPFKKWEDAISVC